MKMNLRQLAAVLVVAGLSLAGTAQGAISYSVGGTGPMQFPSLVAPAPGATWGPTGYPGDTVELEAYSGNFDPTIATQTLKINTLKWTIDYTYGGTATSENPWSDLSFSFNAPRAMSVDANSGALSQAGLLVATFDNDYLSMAPGSTTTFIVGGYQVDVTPLGLDPVGGSNFDGSNPWVQPTRDVYARFDVSAVDVPEPTSMIAWSLLGLTISGAGWWRRRKLTA